MTTTDTATVRDPRGADGPAILHKRSSSLHEGFGFRTVGVLPEFGRTFNRRMGLTMTQLTLDMGVTSCR